MSSTAKLRIRKKRSQFLAGILIGSLLPFFPGIFVPGLLSTASAGYTITCSGGGSFDITSTTIPSGSGVNCKGTVNIPEGVTTINSYGFQNGNNPNFDITEISFPSSLTTINNTSLSQLRSLTSVVIPGSVTYFGTTALQDTPKLINLTFLGGTSAMPLKTGYQLTVGLNRGKTSGFVPQRLVFGDGYSYLRQDAFVNDGFTEIVFGSGTYYVGSGSFRASKSLQSIDFGTSTSPNITLATSGVTTAAQNPFGFAEDHGNSFEGSSISSIRNCDPNPDSAFNIRLKEIKNGNGQSLFSLSTCTNTPPAMTSATPVSAPGWSATSSVTIAGSNFIGLAGLRGVMFGSTPAASFSVNEAGTSITALPPTSLASGTYPVTVNTFGGSSSTDSVTIVTPTVPGAPTGVGGTSADASAVVSWTAPASNGGGAITGYTVTSSPGSFTCTSASSPCTVNGLTNGSLYTFTVVAKNVAGNSPASAASGSVKAGLPGAPTGVGGTSANASAVISWTAPASNGGSAITVYTVTSSPGSKTCTTATTSCTVSALTNGTSYTFTVVATNSRGNSPSSAASGSVTPSAAPVVVYVPPTPIPYLKTLTPPQIRKSGNKLMCTSGTYNAGYTLDGVVQGSQTALYAPAIYTFNLLFDRVAQSSLIVSTSINSATWDLSAAPSGSLASCSVTVTANSLTNTDVSTADSSSVSTALTTQSQSLAAAESAYNAAVSANSKSYQKALVDNRATWRANVDKVRAAYLAELNRINGLPASKATSALKSAALKSYITAQKKTSVDYKASGPAATTVRDLANKEALEIKKAAIVKANAVYGAFIESIGYGVLLP